MPLDDILAETGIKRKAICVTPTRCRFCQTQFLDKWYKGERIHKVRCTRCGLINAEVDIDDYMKLQYQGLRYDIGMYGDLGLIPKGTHFKKMIKEAYGFETDKQIEDKLREYEFGFKKKEEIKKRERTITVKRKGEEEWIMGKKKEKE